MKRTDSNIDSHVAGLISDGSNFPLNSIFDGLNRDFFETYSDIRLPYNTFIDYTDSNAQYAHLPSGYVIKAAKQFRVNDGDTVKDLTIIAAVDADNVNLKILIDKWYNPSNAYGNYASGLSAGWQNKYIDVFEHQDIVVSGLVTGTGVTMFLTGLNSSSKPNNYYNGWFVFNSNKCIGMITNATSSSNMVVTMRRSTEVYDNAGVDGLRYYAIANSDNLMICRFPCVGYNSNFGYGITPMTNTIEFLEDRNGVKIIFSKTDLPNMILEFLPATKFFSTANDWGGGSTLTLTNITGTSPAMHVFTSTPHGLSGGEIIGLSGVVSTFVNNINTTHVVSSILSTTEFIITFVTGGGSYSSGGTMTRADSYKRNWYGFWLGEDAPEITNKKVYRYRMIASGDGTYERYNDSDFTRLGIILHSTFDVVGSGTQTDVRVLAFTIQYSGYQTLFLKNILLDKNITYLGTFLWGGIVFKVDFDRRISRHNLFYGQDTTFTINATHDNEINFGLRMLGSQYGDINPTTTDNTRQYPILTNLFESYVDLFPGVDLSVINTGATVKSYLNNDYWKNVHIKCDSMFKTEDTYVAVNLTDSSASTDLELQKDGAFKVCIAQEQNGVSNTHAIFPDDRVIQLTNTDRLIKGVATVRDEFLIFTDRQVKSYSIGNLTKINLQNDINYQDRGAYNKASIVRAQIGDNFAGVYWLSPQGSIYRFLDKYPEDILDNRWKEHFQKVITEQQKQNAVGGFLSRTREVFWLIGSYIYVWNIDREHWKIYYYSDAPQFFTEAVNSEIIFANSRKLYRTEQPNTTLWKDKGSVTIEWNLKQIISHGDRTVLKIFDRVDLIFEITVNDIEATANITISAGSNSKTSTDILNKTYDVALVNKLTHTIRLRVPNNYYNFKISSASGNIKTFRLNQLKLVSAVTSRQLTSI